jgi:hypothetical protein
MKTCVEVTLMDRMFDGVFPPGDPVVKLFVSPYVFLAGFGATFLIISYALTYFRFDKEPGFGYDPIGRRGANLASSILKPLRPGFAAMLVAGVIGFVGHLAQQPALKIFVSASIAGVFTFIVVAYLPDVLKRLNAEATELPAAVGLLCIVEETVPAAGAGLGKVRVREGAKTAVFVAHTEGEELAEGFRARIAIVVDETHVGIVPESALLDQGMASFMPES